MLVRNAGNLRLAVEAPPHLIPEAALRIVHLPWRAGVPTPDVRKGEIQVRDTIADNETPEHLFERWLGGDAATVLRHVDPA